ncbi:MAG: hypothetical protein ACTHMD_06670, partial [Flavisolibacter sp.]
MKKNYLNLATCILAAAVWSCSDNNTHGTETTTDSTTTTTTMNTDSSRMNDSSTTNTTYTNTTPLGKEDSMFVMEAAMGGMMEVQAGNLAQ